MEDYMKYLGEGDMSHGDYTVSPGSVTVWGGGGQSEKPDYVNHPPHYTSGGVECVDAIEAALTAQTDPVSAWLTGQVIKYLWRFPQKNGVEDLEKAQWYLARMIKREKEAAT